MKQSVILNESQVTRLIETGSVVMVDKVKMPSTVEEPTFGYTAFTPPNHISLRGYFNWVEDGELRRNYGEKFIKLPYALNSTVYVREPWMYSDVKCTWDDGNPSQTQILYKYPNSTRPDGVSIEQWNCAKWVNTSHEHAENVENIIEKMEVFGEKWQSPATMPKSAARLFPVVESVYVVRVQQIDEEQACLLVDKCFLFQDYTKKDFEVLTAVESFATYITSRFGQSFWDNNGWIFLTTLTLNK